MMKKKVLRISKDGRSSATAPDESARCLSWRPGNRSTAQGAGAGAGAARIGTMETRKNQKSDTKPLDWNGTGKVRPRRCSSTDSTAYGPGILSRAGRGAKGKGRWDTDPHGEPRGGMGYRNGGVSLVSGRPCVAAREDEKLPLGI